ncbi:MAG: hypothetical protein ACXVBE_11380 [Bdellovibrionota bacterium]
MTSPLELLAAAKAVEGAIVIWWRWGGAGAIGIFYAGLIIRSAIALGAVEYIAAFFNFFGAAEAVESHAGETLHGERKHRQK